MVTHKMRAAQWGVFLILIPNITTRTLKHARPNAADMCRSHVFSKPQGLANDWCGEVLGQLPSRPYVRLFFSGGFNSDVSVSLEGLILAFWCILNI